MTAPFLPLPPQPWGLLTPGTVHLWQLPIPTTAGWLPQWQGWLAGTERDRADRFHRDRDRHTFILARGGLRWLLGQYLGVAPEVIAFSYGDHGKPQLAAPPSLDPALTFNLAHSGDWVVYALTRGAAIGVDVEAIAPRRYGEGLIQRCLTPQEQHTLSPDLATRQRQFFDYWTAKEAYLKATGQGLSYPMTAVEVVWTTAHHGRLVAPSAAQPWTLRSWQPAPAMVAAVCVAMPTTAQPMTTPTLALGNFPLSLL